MKRLPKENEYQLDIKDQFKNEFEIGQLQGNNFHMTDSADLPMLIEPQGNIEQEVIEAVEGIVVEGSSINVNDVDTSYEDSIMPKGNIEQVVVEEIPGNTIEGEIINITNGDSTKEVKAIVNGNSYQETIAEEVGTTVVNKSIHLTDVNAAKESKLAPNGGIEQDSRVGYNELDTSQITETSTLNGVTRSYDKKTGIITLNGTGTADNSQLGLMPVGTERILKGEYTLFVEYISGTLSNATSNTNVQIQNNTTWYDGMVLALKNNSVLNARNRESFTANYYVIRYDTGVVFNNYKIRVMLIKGLYTLDTIPKFELYGSMPSLAFPSEVKGVGSEKEINLVDIQAVIGNTYTKVVEINPSYIILEQTSATKLATIHLNVMNLKTGVTYTVKRKTEVLSSYKDTDTGNVEIYLGSKWKKVILHANKNEATFTVDEDGEYSVMLKVAQTNVSTATIPVKVKFYDVMVYEGTEDLPYTPYGYCRYDNVVGNKNIFDENIFATKTINGLTAKFENGKLSIVGTPTVDTNLNWDYKLDNSLLNKEITLSYSGDLSTIHNVGLKKVGSDRLVLDRNMKSKTITATQTIIDDINQISFWCTKNQVINASINIQLEVGTAATPYTPHQSQTLPIDIPRNKEIFDKTNYSVLNRIYFNSTDKTALYQSSLDDVKSIYIPCEENKTYDIYKISSSKFTIGYTKQLPATGVQAFNIMEKTTATHATITTGAGAKYLVIYLYFIDTDTTITFEQIVNSISIKEQKEQNIWYSGKPYKENGKWYRDVEYGKQEINNSLTITRYVASGFDCYRITNLQNLNNSKNAIIKSNIFKGIIPIYGENAYIANRKVGDIYINNMINAIDMLTKNGEYADATSFINAVAGNYFVYQLATPIKEEITDTTLIAQLEALEKAEFYDGVTNINTYSSSENVANLPIEAHYNFITPSPSVERPSDIEVVKTYNLYNTDRMPSSNGTIGGVNFSKVEVGGIKANGTSTGNKSVTYFDISGSAIVNDIPIVVGKKLYVSAKSTNKNLAFAVYIRANNTYYELAIVSNTEKEITIPENAESWLLRVVNNGATGQVFNDDIIYPMIAETSGKPYLPYGHIGLLQRGKNFFDLKDEITDLNYSGIKLTTNKNRIKYNGTNTIGDAINPNGWGFAPLKYNLPAGNYIFSLKKISGSYNKNGNTDAIYLRDKDKNIIKDFSTFAYFIENNHQAKFTNPKAQTVYFQHYCNAGITFENLEVEIQIERDTGSATEIVEPTSNLIPIDLQGNTLAKIDDTIRDLLNIGLDGSVSIEKKTNEYIFTGKENYGLGKNGKGLYYIPCGVSFTDNNSKISYMNYLKRNENMWNVAEKEDIFKFSDNNLALLNLMTVEHDTAEGLKAWLQEKYNNGVPMKILYSANARTIQLPSIKPIKLFEGTNNFELVTNLDTTINMTYNHVGYSPSIVKPSEVKGVGSDKTINYLDMLDIFGGSNISVTNSTNESVDVETVDYTKDTTIYFKAKNLKAGVTYKASVLVEFLSGTIGKAFGRIELYDGYTWIKAFGYYNASTNSTSGTFTVDKDGTYNIRFLVSASSDNLAQSLKIKLKEFMVYDYTNKENKLFTPYGYCRYHNKVKNKNILELPEFTQTQNGLTLTYNKGVVTLKGTTIENKTYFFYSHKVATAEAGKTYYFDRDRTNLDPHIQIFLGKNVGAFETEPTFMTNVSKKAITTDGDLYLLIYMQQGIGAGTNIDVTFQPQLAISEVATEIVEHQSQSLPTDIPVGQEWYSGKPYKVNGKWYRPIEYGKDYIEPKFLVGNPTYRFIYTDTKFAKYDTANIGYSNIGNLIGSGTGEVEVPNIWLQPENNRINIVWNSKDAPNPETLNAKLQALIDSGTQPYFVAKLATPIREEITDPVLISQLEALQNAEFYDGVTNINSYRLSEDVADMPLEAHYNFITPSPSIDRPSEVLEVGSEEDINLYNIGDVEETTKNGITYSIKNGRFKANGTATQSFTIATTNVKFDLESGVYTLGSKVISGTYSGIVGKYVTKAGATVIDGNLIDAVGRKNLTEKATSVYASIYVNNGVVFNNYEADLMLVKGEYTKDTLPPYTPYGYCRYDIVVQNANIYSPNIGIEDGYLDTLNGEIIKGAGWEVTEFIPIPESVNTITILNGWAKSEGHCFYDEDKKFIFSRGIASSTGGNLKIALPNNVKYARFTVNNTYKEDCMIAFGDYDNFIPHQEQSLPIDLPIGMKMYNDEFFYKENGKWWRNIKYVKSKLTSDMEWYLEVFDGIGRPRTNYFADIIKNVSAVNTVRVYSNYFKQNYGNNDYVFGNLKVGYLGFYTNKLLYLTTYFKNVNDWKTYLDENDVYIVFEIEPYPEEITDANLIAQLEKTLTPFSYYPVTNINSYRPTTNVADLKLYAEYFKSNKITNK